MIFVIKFSNGHKNLTKFDTRFPDEQLHHNGIKIQTDHYPLCL